MKREYTMVWFHLSTDSLANDACLIQSGDDRLSRCASQLLHATSADDRQRILTAFGFDDQTFGRIVARRTTDIVADRLAL